MSLHVELERQALIDELQGALRKAQSALNRQKARNDEVVAAVYRAAKDAALSVKPPAPMPPPKDKRTKKAEVALIHATDWQLGKRTTSYDVETCGKRIDLFASKVLRITEIQRRDHPVKEAVLMLGGDMVEGVGIYEAQPFEIEAHLFEQLFEVVRVIERLVRTLAANFEKVRVICEYGNHGRIGKFGALPKADNVDRMAYRIAAERTANLPNVAWQMSDDFYQHFTIGRYRVLLVHGDEIRSYSGTPLFAIIKRVSAWAAGVVPTFDDAYLGHWHSPLSVTLGNGNRAFITGSPESGNVYAAEHLAAQSIPSQRLHFVDPEAGRVTAEFVVWLD